MNSNKKLLHVLLTLFILLAFTFSLTRIYAIVRRPAVILTGVKPSYCMNQRPYIRIRAGASSGNFQYRVCLFDVRKQQITSDISKGYTKKSYSANQYVAFKLPELKNGIYKIYAYIRRAGSKIIYEGYAVKGFRVYNAYALANWGEELKNKETTSSIVVSASNTMISNVKTTGDIVVNPGINGATYINNVTARNITVKSGGIRNIRLNTTTVTGKLIVNVADNTKVGLVSNGTTKIASTILYSNAYLENTSGSFGTILVRNLKLKNSAEVEFKGNFDAPVTVVTANKIIAGNSSKGIKLKTAPVDKNKKIQLYGKYESIEILRPTKLKLSDNSIVTDKIKIDTSADITSLSESKPNIEVASTAKNAAITLSGKFNNLDVKANSKIKLTDNTEINKLITQEKVNIETGPKSKIDAVDTKKPKDINITGSSTDDLKKLTTAVNVDGSLDLKLEVGKTLDYTIQNSPDDCINTVKSSNDKISTGQIIDKKIRIKAVSVGSAQLDISASKDGLMPSDATINVTVMPLRTVQGTLSIDPNNMAVNSAQSLSLSYRLGENYNKGRVNFILPAGFKAVSTDTVSISDAKASEIGGSAINNQVVTIDNITAQKDKIIKLTLAKCSVPSVNNFIFSANGDADGDVTTKMESLGTDGETKNISVVNSILTQSGVLQVDETSTNSGDSKQTVTLVYKLGEDYNNGRVIFNLPAGFKASTKCTGGIGSSASTLSSSAINGQNVTFNKITAKMGDEVTLKLVDQTLPQPSSYTFSATGDADADLNGRAPSAGSGTEAVTISLNSSQTTKGTLTVTPLIGSAGTVVKEIKIDYKLGEAYTKGTVRFTLPSGFTMLSTDSATIDGKSTSSMVNLGQTIVINDITGESGKSVILTLKSKTLPTVGTYNFTAMGDADGTITSRTESDGSGSELNIFSSNAIQTTAGKLTLNPTTERAYALGEKLAITYTFGEDFNSGTVTINMPNGFKAQSGDTYICTGQSTATAVPSSSYGSKVVLSNITANAGQTVTLNLAARVFPSKGTYSFSVNGDADGSSTSKMPSDGIGGEVSVLTLTTGTTIPGSLTITPDSGYTGVTQTVTIKYVLNDIFKSGKVVFTIPSGFIPTPNDMITLGSGSEDSIKNSSSKSVSINGSNIIISNITASTGYTITIRLPDRKLPSAATYMFTAASDADGNGTELTMSPGTNDESKQLVVQSIKATTDGTLTITPATASASTSGQNLVLEYALGENYTSGKVTFDIPYEIRSLISSTDTYTIGNNMPVQLSGDYSNKSLVIEGINASKGDIIKICLNNKTLPKANKYTFKVIGDADGDSNYAANTGLEKTPSSGGSGETRILVLTSSATIQGWLTVTPDTGLTTNNTNVKVDYIVNDTLLNGKVVITFPALSNFRPALTDSIIITDDSGSTVKSGILSSLCSINGNVVTINNLTALPGYKISIMLTNRTLPSAGTYTFVGQEDADGAGTDRTLSVGTNNETDVFTVSAIPVTTSGYLSVDATNQQSVCLKYCIKEDYVNGTVIFTLPSSINPALIDQIVIGGSTYNVTAMNISGHTLIVSKINLDAGNEIKIYLNNKSFTAGQTYTFSAKGDADGAGTAKNPSTGSGDETTFFIAQ